MRNSVYRNRLDNVLRKELSVRDSAINYRADDNRLDSIDLSGFGVKLRLGFGNGNVYAEDKSVDRIVFLV